jgi:hypothetical protein
VDDLRHGLVCWVCDYLAELMARSISKFQRGKGSSHCEHLVLVRTKVERYPCAGAPTRTRRECRLFETSGKTGSLLVPTSLSAFTLIILLSHPDLMGKAWCVSYVR